MVIIHYFYVSILFLFAVKHLSGPGKVHNKFRRGYLYVPKRNNPRK